MKSNQNVFELESLPLICRSKEGVEFNLNLGTWAIVDQTKHILFHFDFLDDLFTRDLSIAYKKVVSHYIQSNSLSHAHNMHNLFFHFSKTINSTSLAVDTITSTHLLNYKASLGPHTWYLGSLKGFFKKWHSLGYPGIGEDALRLLNSLRIEGNPKGEAVRTMDPQKGPFTENELLSIHENLHQQYKNGLISNREFALVWLFMAIGQRPVQFAMTKVKDFMTVSAGDGSVKYILKLPRAKQRGVAAREEFSERLLCNEAGLAVAAWVEQLRSHHRVDVSVLELPLFPQWGHESPLGLHHMTSQALGQELKGAVDRLEITSERTGETIKFSSKRFKHTVGTRAAEEGHGELVIAQLLDHSDTQNVRVYVEATPKFVEAIDKAMAPYMAPIAQAFKGVIIKSDQECPDGIRIGWIGLTHQGVGKCGHHGFCDAAAPQVCYVCTNFHPWLHGPHEEVLRELLDERERVEAATKDRRISGAKDRIIMAVQQVIQMCNQVKGSEVLNG